MKSIKITVCAIFSILTLSCSNSKNDKYIGNSAPEVKAEKCLDKWIEKKGVSWEELRLVFENYYAEGNISDPSEPVADQYNDILNFWAQPTKRFPSFRQRNKAAEIQAKLGLSDEDIRKKAHLDCLTNAYVENKSIVDTASAFYAFGATMESLKEIPNVSPGLVARALNFYVDKTDLNRELYQKTIILLYLFEMKMNL